MGRVKERSSADGAKAPPMRATFNLCTSRQFQEFLLAFLGKQFSLAELRINRASRG